MKKTVFLISIIVSLYGYSQEIKISDLEVPNSPAFTLMDFTPTTISNPTTPQAVSLNLLSALSSNNVAIEFSPYWLSSGKHKTITSYYEGEEQKSFSKPFKNLSVSIATIKNDSIQNVSFGFRTNIFTINSQQKINSIGILKAKLVAFNATLAPLLPVALNPYPAGTTEFNEWNIDILNKMAKDPTYVAQSAEIYENNDALNNIKPLLSLDFATAYNHFFTNDEYKKGNFGRFGAWATLNENINIGSNKNYLSLYQYGRFLIDEMTYDSTTLNYKREENFDLGGKIELQFNKLSFGYEYIKRTNQKDNYRSVGNIKYKLNNDIVLNGGFGKNFEGANNLVTLLGISWGITSNNSITN